MIIDIDSVVVACQGDEKIIIPFDLHSGLLREFSFYIKDLDLLIVDTNLVIDGSSFMVKMPKGLKPNKYECVVGFGEQSCGKEEENIILDLRYSNDIIVQRWNDVLAVVNADYNGGYQFVAFQWYKNGNIIEGANSSILYEPEGLDFDAEYSVLLTRLSDHFTTLSCIAELEDLAFAQGSSVLVFSYNGQVGVEISNVAHLNIWSTNGALLTKCQLSEGYNSIELDLNKGVYIFEFIFDDNCREIEQVYIK